MKFKYYDIVFAFIVIPICVLLGSWVFEASFAVTFLVILFGVIFGTLVEWKKLTSNDGSFRPKHELFVYGLIFLITLAIVYKFPQIRTYGFF